MTNFLQEFANFLHANDVFPQEFYVFLHANDEFLQDFAVFLQADKDFLQDFAGFLHANGNFLHADDDFQQEIPVFRQENAVRQLRNLAMPVSNWTRILTNQFDSGGGINFTNTMNSNSPSGFYLLQIP